MASWQYAWLTDQPYTTIGFSHPQPGLAAELASVLGIGVMAAQSNEWSISLDRSRVNLGYVSGMLGDRGWEMFSVETRLQPAAMTPSQLQTNWYFKKSGPDKPAASVAAMSSTTTDAQAAAPAASQWGTQTAAPSAPTSPAAPAASTMTTAPSMTSAPEMAAQTPAFTAPQPPSAPPGPEPAPMSGASTPPPGPQGPTMPQS